MPFPEISLQETHNPFQFVVYGDIQGDYRDGHRRILEQMGSQTFDFMMSVGDISSDEGRDYEKEFLPEVSPVAIRIPFFPTPGNHDIRWDSRLSRYPFRSFFRESYSWLANQPGNSHLIPETQRLWYTFRYGSGLFIVLDSNLYIGTGYYGDTHELKEYRGYAEEQLRWAQRVLRESLDDPSIESRFVFLHHSPFFSKERRAFLGLFGGHEDDREEIVNQRMPPNEEKIEYLLDLFRYYRVTAVFSGHEHYYERWRETLSEEGRPFHSLDWVLVGSGGVSPRSHREYGDEKVEELFEEGSVYEGYVERASRLNPGWSAELARVFPNESQTSGKFRSYTLVSVDQSRVRFETIDTAGRTRDSGLLGPQ